MKTQTAAIIVAILVIAVSISGIYYYITFVPSQVPSPSPSSTQSPQTNLPTLVPTSSSSTPPTTSNVPTQTYFPNSTPTPSPIVTPTPQSTSMLTTTPPFTQTPTQTSTPTPAPTSTPTLTATPTPSSAPAPTNTPAPQVWTDGRIGIILNKVEKTEVVPDDIKGFLSGVALTPDLKQGMDYVFVNLTISNIVNVHLLTTTGYGNESTSLAVNQGHEYNCLLGVTKGIKYSDPNNIQSPTEVAEGAKVVIIFEIPKQENPTSLKIVYSFRVTWDGSENRGQLNIVL